MARMIELPETLVFDLLIPLEAFADQCRELGEPDQAKEWEEDANTIRRALGIEIDNANHTL